MIDICCVESGVKYHSQSYGSIVMKSPVEFLTAEFRERREISLTVLLVSCHDFSRRIFDRWISPQTGMKRPLKWHNQPGKDKQSTLS